MTTTMRAVLRAAAEIGSCTPERIKATVRDVVQYRKAAQYICRVDLNGSYPAIGQVFYRDHTTVLSNVEKVKATLEAEPYGEMADLVEAIRIRAAEIMQRPNQEFRPPQPDPVPEPEPQPETQPEPDPLPAEPVYSHFTRYAPWTREWWLAQDQAMRAALQAAGERIK